jgi:REP element-mobilizing transposase RayT
MAGKYLSLLIHFVWSTAGRERLIHREWQDRLYSFIGGVLREKNAKLIAAGGIDDHIHLYSSIPSTITIADLVSAMKANSSRWVHQNFPKLRGFAWQKGYGAFSVSKSAEKSVIEYIKNQEKHHRRISFKEEFVMLLEKHGVEYDLQYIWD